MFTNTRHCFACVRGKFAVYFKRFPKIQNLICKILNIHSRKKSRQITKSIHSNYYACNFTKMPPMLNRWHLD